MKIKKLVIDTAAFLKNVPLWEYGEEFYTVPEVIAEIKDRQTKHLINSLPMELKFQTPSPNSIKFIVDFTKKTGDYASLSLADIKVLALTYELEVLSKGNNEHLRIIPLECRTEVHTHNPSTKVLQPVNIEGFYLSEENRENGSSVSVIQSKYDTDAIKVFTDSGNKGNSSENSSELIDPFALTFYHMDILNTYFSEFTYAGGYHFSVKDFVLKEALRKSFPLIESISIISAKLNAAGKTTFISKLYRTLISDMCIEVKAHDVIVANDCESYSNFKYFMHQFSSFPYFLRWFFHIQTFHSDDISLNLPADDISFIRALNDCFKNIEIKKIIETVPLIRMTECVEQLSTELRETLQVTDPSEESMVDTDSSEERLLTQGPSEVENEGKRLELDPHESDEGFDQLSEEEEESTAEEQESASDDDDEGWITPSNLKYIKNKTALDGITENIDTACITADYAMQNTLKHIGLRVMGVDGKIIHNLRTFILRCFACFKTTDKMDLIFCKQCGNKTLKKVAVTLNPDGTQKIWISSKRPINIRGTKFSLPKPRGGKHAINPILVADQREAQQRATKLARMRNDPMHEDYGTGISPFIPRDIYSRSAQLGITSGSKKQHRGLFYWEQRNPNVPMKKKSGRKK